MLKAIDLGAVEAISAGGYHTCALLKDKDIKCWGQNSDGQLGIERETDVGGKQMQLGAALKSVELGNHKNARVVAGSIFTCALLDDGNIKCWGANEYGQLGQGGKADLGITANEMGEALFPIKLW